MKLLSNTINQHYLPQVEQRLNTCSAPGVDRRKQRIYKFEIQQRGTSDEIKLGPAAKKLIEGNLSLDDLFSFDVEPRANLRHNFEALFQRYEEQLKTHTEALLKKAEVRSADIVDELFALYSAKLLNFIRNPYVIHKSLDTFKSFKNHHPTDPESNHLFQLVLNGRKPHQVETCKRLGITNVQYREWLGILFMLLTELEPGQENMLDAVVRQMFTDKKQAVFVMISMYTKEKCLLSDRSFSTNVLQGPDKMGMDFNLRHDAFIRYVFISRAASLPPDMHPDRIAFFETLDQPVNAFYVVDDLMQLRGFNMNVINQSHSSVFCAAKDGILF
ncbi:MULTISPECIES: hypothetical protein [unclassified Herbaspirillum]|uniref:hypothetical protein n=1 Tax=unclassified Herbaspirillum TaxID=2624150 RepID=UPI000E2F79F9|nr:MULTISPECIES: hypothetical protein [unclassified Herbaspirillum]RFB73804.1 hypothetical protein DZB54_05890 [Herbaspirillum sp. 3R-3a1]TFI10385.1 hypothetical protein E4P32_02280 [Herbaspirillum sp. 3R11]TFI16290.1 hypothetical protein E4P31_02285 [Herbaspirillum sp. 3R-11]TFI21694.1 hypothetical protein E4P30_20345 [Herbaspirillum sp. 3C11]